MEWARCPHRIVGDEEPGVRDMPAMLRRRAGFLGKMALEVAYRCLGRRVDIPVVFSSRHGEASRSVDLLLDLARGTPLSPTSFSLSVHNASCGLYSIARGDRASGTALSAGKSSIEYAVIEACGLLAEGAPAVLMVAYDCPLPSLYSAFQDCDEQPFAWAWLIEPPSGDVLSLSWSTARGCERHAASELPPGLEILRFYLCQASSLMRISNGNLWLWTRHV